MSEPDLSMWAKQLASTVRQGKKITVSILDEEIVSGYLAGMDNSSILLMAPFDDGRKGAFFNKLLIPRNAILYVQFHEEKTFMDEPLYRDMNAMARPFKDYVNKVYFGRENEPSATGTTSRSEGSQR